MDVTLNYVGRNYMVILLKYSTPHFILHSVMLYHMTSYVTIAHVTRLYSIAWPCTQCLLSGGGVGVFSLMLSHRAAMLKTVESRLL